MFLEQDTLSQAFMSFVNMPKHCTGMYMRTAKILIQRNEAQRVRVKGV